MIRTTRKRIKLPKDLIPRDYQYLAKDEAIRLITEEPDKWHLFTAPTGTGKSVIMLLIMAELPECILCTPRLEIIAGFLQKLGHDVEDLSTDAFVDLAQSYGLWTPIRLRNALAAGILPFLPSAILIDECHHDLAESYQDITMYLNGVPKCGFTATPYRGTPRSTAEFLAQWSDTVNVILALADSKDEHGNMIRGAVSLGYCSFPTATVWPLVDDDIIEVSNGEIKASAADAVITDRIEAIVDRIKSASLYCRRSKMWDRATMFAMPTTNTVHALVTELGRQGIKAEAVIQSTPRRERQAIFARTVACTSALVQIDVVSEGIDLPLRRIIDIGPTLSPRKWVQRIGREMRPVTVCQVCRSSGAGACSCEPMPEYICCCRNLERHGYLMEGMLPNSTVKEAQEAFERPSRRAGMRALGLEELGKFTTTPVELINGITCLTWNLILLEEFKRTEYFALIHPNHMEPVYGIRESIKNPETNEMRWGQWKLVEALPSTKGFQTTRAFPLTEKQRKRWDDWAKGLGLNPHREVTARNVQVLFFLKDVGLRIT